MQASKEIGRPIVHEFTREALVEAGAVHTVPPFSIVASNTMDLSVGRSAILQQVEGTVTETVHVDCCYNTGVCSGHALSTVPLACAGLRMAFQP